jgi:hypothetical protein
MSPCAVARVGPSHGVFSGSEGSLPSLFPLSEEEPCRVGMMKCARIGATAGSGGIVSEKPASPRSAAIFLPCRIAEPTIDCMTFRFVPVVGRRRLFVWAATMVDSDAADEIPPRPSMVTSPSSPFCLAFASF